MSHITKHIRIVQIIRTRQPSTNEVFKRKLVETKENWNEKCKK